MHSTIQQKGTIQNHSNRRHRTEPSVLQGQNDHSERKIDHNYRVRRLEKTFSSLHVVDDEKASIIGCNILPQIGIKLIQEQYKQNVHVVREQEESDPKFEKWVKDNIQQLCVRIGKP